MSILGKNPGIAIYHRWTSWRKTQKYKKILRRSALNGLKIDMSIVRYSVSQRRNIRSLNMSSVCAIHETIWTDTYLCNRNIVLQSLTILLCITKYTTEIKQNSLSQIFFFTKVQHILSPEWNALG